MGFSGRVFQGVTQNLHEQSKFTNVERDLNSFSRSISDGVLFHELLEKAKTYQGAIEAIPHFFKSDLSKHKEAIGYLFEQTDCPFDMIFKYGMREWGFDTTGESKKSGKIDLWARLDNTVWVVDYKTGSTANLEKGFEQLSAYKEVLFDFIGQEDLVFKLVQIFPYSQKTFIRV